MLLSALQIANSAMLSAEAKVVINEWFLPWYNLLDNGTNPCEHPTLSSSLLRLLSWRLTAAMQRTPAASEPINQACLADMCRALQTPTSWAPRQWLRCRRQPQSRAAVSRLQKRDNQLWQLQ